MNQAQRRQFLLTAGAVLAAPFAAIAQQLARLPRIGILTFGPSSQLDGFYRGLNELGYIEGKNILIERRFTGNNVGNARVFAQELVALKVDVIFALASTYVEAARQVTADIPIVFAVHNDPVGTGHVASLAHPGGNITGVSQVATDLNAKQLQLLKELVPHATRVAVLSNPTTPSHVPALREVKEASSKLGLQLHLLEASSLEQIELAFAAAAEARDDVLLLLSSPLSVFEYNKIAPLCLKYRVPTLFGHRESVEAGGLISYGPDLIELNRHAAVYVDKILRGARPADLPVEQPTKFELVINLKTAQALGITIPQTLLLRADEVIR
jgi:putative ABC transport system substrate-binding protein